MCESGDVAKRFQAPTQAFTTHAKTSPEAKTTLNCQCFGTRRFVKKPLLTITMWVNIKVFVWTKASGHKLMAATASVSGPVELGSSRSFEVIPAGQWQMMGSHAGRDADSTCIPDFGMEDLTTATVAKSQSKMS